MSATLKELMEPSFDVGIYDAPEVQKAFLILYEKGVTPEMVEKYMEKRYGKDA